jgi:integrase
MRGLFRWALEAGMVKVDLTAGVKNPQRPKGDGFRPWTEDDVAAYEKCWPIGTRQRVWLDVMLYTGLRRGDAVRLGRQHIRDGDLFGDPRRREAAGLGLVNHQT